MEWNGMVGEREREVDVCGVSWLVDWLAGFLSRCIER